MKNNVKNIIAITAVAGTCVVSIGFGVYSTLTARKVSKKLGTTLDKLMDKTDVQVSETVVNTAVNEKVDKVVTREVKKAAETAVNAIKNDMHTSIKKEVSEAVRERSEAIETGIKEEYDRQLAHIDIDDLSKEIKKEAKQKMMRRLDGAFDTLVGEHSENLAKLTKVYSSIAETIGKKA